MFLRILVSALFAGAFAGILAGILQWFFVQPVLLHSELYETGELVHFGGAANSAHPELDYLQPVRDALSIMFTMLIYISYALILIAFMSLQQQKSDKPISLHQGIVWGIGGYITFHLAPAISLPPEVPGVAASEVDIRQIWWYGTVVATGLGLWLIAFNNSVKWFIGGAVLLILPHAIGAPEPDIFTGPAPTELGALFASRALGIGLASWAILGGASAYFFGKESARAEAQAHAQA